jgi:hypothetical protein
MSNLLAKLLGRKASIMILLSLPLIPGIITTISLGTQNSPSLYPIFIKAILFKSAQKGA